MATMAAIARNNRRIKKSTKAKAKRLELKELIRIGTPEEQEAAILKLQKCPRDESPIRIRDRCQFCGRPNGTLRKFGLCRIHLREAMVLGLVPGLRKASW